MNESEILKTLDRIWERSNVRTALYGRLGTETGSVADIEVVGRPGYVYVSMGDLGDQGINIAKDKVGVARTIFQQVKMRRELGELVIYEAASYAGGTGNGNGDGGVTSFFELSDVNPVGWDSGEVPTWNSSSGKFEPLLPPAGGEGSGNYYPGDGIQFNGSFIEVKENPIRGIVVDSSGVGVFSTLDTGLRADATRGLYIFTKTNSGLDIDTNGISVGAGDGISVEGEAVQVKLAPGVAAGGVNSGLGFGGQGGLYIGAGDGINVLPNTIEVMASALVGLGIEEDGDNNFKVKLAPGESEGGVNAGLGFGGAGGLYIGEGNGINVLPSTIEVKLAPGEGAGGVNAGLAFGGAGGLYVGAGDGIGVAEDSVNVRLSQPSSGLDFGADGGLLVGEGDGIDVETNTIKVNVVEIINPAYGIYHDGSNNIVVALEPDSGLRYNDPSGRLELGEPGILSVTSVSELINDTHFHQVLSSSDPGSTQKLLATDLDGGLRLDTNLLYVDAANNRVGINTVPENEWGAATLDVFAANPADHTQRIKQMVGQTGRMWRIEDSGGDELIVLDSVGNLQSGKPGFVSGLTGWQITPQGNAEFNNIWARGELHATVFVKDEVHATGGTFMVATAATFYEDAHISDANLDEDELWVISAAAGSGPLEVVTTSPTFEGNTLWVSGVVNEIKLNHPPSGPAIYFQPGEILRVKTEVNEEGNPLRLADIWLVVNYATVEDDYGLYSVEKVSGSNATIPGGTAIVTYGKPGDGAILMTSDWRPASNDEGYAPYIDIFTTGEQPWLADDEGITPHVRLGQLKGVGLPGLSGVNKFGMVAGQDLADANSAYMVASEDGVEIYRGVIRLNNGANDTGLWDADGNLRLGTNISQAATTGFRVVMTADAPYNVAGDEPGDVVIGDPTKANYLKWDASAGTLVVSGALQVAGAVEAATQTWVTQQDDIYRGYAEQYTDDQVALIEIDGSAYADSRRIQSIDAVFNSTAYNIISWAAFSVFLANGTARPVTANTSYTLSASFSRFWMYVNLNAADPLVLQFATSAAAVNQPSYVLLGVVTKGASTPIESRASVTVVAGSTYISGASIFTGSITAASIAASAIETEKLDAYAVTAGKIATEVFTSIDGKRIKHIEGMIVPTVYPPGPKNQVVWSNAPTNILKVTRANGTTVTVVAGNAVIADRSYAYILDGVTNVTNYALGWYRPGFAPALPANAIIIAVAQEGATAATVTMTAGGVVISGNDIVAGSITADRLVANSITAGQIDAGLYTTYEGNITKHVEGRRVMAVNGTFNSLGPARISWSGVRVVRADGLASYVVSDNSGYNLPASRNYFYIDPAVVPFSGLITPAATNIDSLPAGAIMVAIADTGTEKATIIMVGGGVVISGDDIVADSIVATKIKAGEIKVAKVETNFFTANNTALANSVKGDMAAITVVAVGNKIATVPATIGRFTWPGMSVKFADDTYWIVPANSTGYTIGSTSPNARAYFYIDTAEAVNSPLRVKEVLGDVPPTGIILGVGEEGTTHSSVTMTYGGVIISGNHITAGSITANQINVNQLDAFDTTTATLTTGALTINGALTLNSTGKIYSAGKLSPAHAPAGGGFFMGYDTTTPAGYKFYVGENQDYLRFDPGDGISFGSQKALSLTSHGVVGDTGATAIEESKVFFFQRNTALVNQQDLSLWHATTGMKADGNWEFLAQVKAQSLLVAPATNAADAIRFQVGANAIDRLRYTSSTSLLDWSGPFYCLNGLTVGENVVVGGSVIRIAQSSTNPAHSDDATATKGDIRWYPGTVGSGGVTGYLLIYIGSGVGEGWRRIPLGSDF